MRNLALVSVAPAQLGIMACARKLVDSRRATRKFFERDDGCPAVFKVILAQTPVLVRVTGHPRRDRKGPWRMYGEAVAGGVTCNIETVLKFAGDIFPDEDSDSCLIDLARL